MLGSTIALILYLFIITYLGYLGYKHTKTSADYLVGGRQIHPLIMALSYGATFISTSAIVGFGGAAGTLGMGLLWLTFLNIFFGIFIAFVVFGKRTRKMGHNVDAHTFPELLGNRFNSRFIQGFAGAIIFLFMPIYAAAVLKGGSDFIQTHFGISYQVSLLFFAAVVAIYVWMGGLKGVMYTDAFQGIIMFVAMAFLLIFAYSKLGGIISAHNQLTALFDKPEVKEQTAKLIKGGFQGWTSMPVLGSPIWWSLVSTIVMGVGIGVLAQPQLVVRFMTVNSNRDINRAVVSGGIFIIMMTGVAFVVGSLSNVFFFNDSGKIAIVAAGGNDKIIPAFIKLFVPGWFGIVFFLALIAAAMSTLSSQFHAMGTAAGRDIYEKALQKKGNTIFITKTGILVTILMSVVLAFLANKLDASMQIIATGTAMFFGLCAASFLPAYVSALYIKKISKEAIIAGMITGFVVGIFWIFFIHEKEATSLQLCNLLFSKTSLVKDTGLAKLAMVDPIIIAFPASIIATVIGAFTSKNSYPRDTWKNVSRGFDPYKTNSSKRLSKKYRTAFFLVVSLRIVILKVSMTTRSKIRFKSVTSDQAVLFPGNIGDKIGINHPVRIVSQIVDSLNIDDIIFSYKGGGTSSFHPRIMLKVLFYSYFNNVYSCRKIEQLLHENIYFMWLSGNNTPNFRTINDFRGKRLKGKIQDIFAEMVRMMHGLGYVSLDVQYVDGTKIEAASNRYTFVWKGSVEKNKSKLETKIRSVLENIESAITADNQDENPPSGGIEHLDSEQLQNKIGELNQKLALLNKKQQKEVKKLGAEDLPRLQKYEQQLETLGDRNSYSKTDTDATFMRMKEDHMKNGQLKPAYNVQISTENQIIVNFSMHQRPGDTATLIPHLEQFEAQQERQSKEVVADAGYGSEQNYEYAESNEIEAFIKYNFFHKEQKRKFKNDPFHPSNLFYNAEKDFIVCPMGQQMKCISVQKRKSELGYESQVKVYKAINCEGCPLRWGCHKSKNNRQIELNHKLLKYRNQAREKLLSERGLEHRSKRPIEPEAVFGQVKSNNRFNRFKLRGLSKVEVEFGLVAISHNLRKIAQRMSGNRQKSQKQKEKGLLNPIFSRILQCETYLKVKKEPKHKIYSINLSLWTNQKIAA